MESFTESLGQLEDDQFWPVPHDSGVIAPAERKDEIKVERDETFYFDEVIFLVEKRLFKVPRYYFQRDSQVFRDMFQLPIPENGVVDGSSDQNPLRLDGIRQTEFRLLLRRMFPSTHDEKPLSYDDWISILKLSSMWQFENHKQQAILAISQLPMDAVEKFILAQKYEVTSWLIPTLNELAQREKPMQMEDVNRLGIDCVLKIAIVRESRARRAPGIAGSYRDDTRDIRERGKVEFDFSQRIRTVFGI